MVFEQDFDGDNYLNKPRKEEEIFPGGQIQVTKCKRCEVRQGEKETGLGGGGGKEKSFGGGGGVLNFYNSINAL